MKIAVICNSDSLAFPAISSLISQGWLAGAGILARSSNVLLSPLLGMAIPKQNIAQFTKEAWQSEMQNWLQTIAPDMVWVFGFPWLIPSSILAIPEGGFLNFHFGNLPRYKGADPIFWQLKNGEEKAALVVHRMTPVIDDGPILMMEELRTIKGENYGLFCQRLGFMAAGLVQPLVDNYLNKSFRELDKPGGGEAACFKKPGYKTLKINWDEQSADEIEYLVNASNPKYDGASTYLRNAEIRILETSPAEIQLENNFRPDPGTIVYADAVYGLIVACRGSRFLKINVVHTQEGYFSGSKLFSMGVQAGEKFINLN
ncbi:formyltransferase family protein [Mucilaginibacter sp.]|jgi:methionyl-tRNA formyltransferase|uniref:formyltransferase family protein n=1 Tax=Mucilaginibacter sp. TaxID=1882438 RepID=UPI002C0ADA8B|nr:formyltransferase family protein [Mucilaginibacter sp.]HTI60167.1 formyltransferase family protein [Mucilaginibacter sp.]